MSSSWYEIVLSKELSNKKSSRFVVIDPFIHSVIDDAQGYGYRSAEKALKSFLWKRHNGFIPENLNKGVHKALDWLERHPNFKTLLQKFNQEISDGFWGPEIQFDGQFIQELLFAKNFRVNFTGDDLYMAWLSDNQEKI